jgi:hypothetical protein
MRFFVKLIIAVLFLAILLPFTFLKGKDGRPLLSLDDLKAPDISLPDISIPKVFDDVKLPKLPEASPDQDIVYQWYDAEGNLNFTSQPPPQGTEYTVKGYDPNTNLIQSVELDEEPEASDSDSEQNANTPVKGVSEIGSPYSPEKVEQLFNDAKNIEKLLNDRMKQQEAMIGQ